MRKRERDDEPLESDRQDAEKAERTFSALFVIIAVGIVLVVLVLVART
jgi:hypothetical protein